MFYIFIFFNQKTNLYKIYLFIINVISIFQLNNETFEYIYDIYMIFFFIFYSLFYKFREKII